MKLLAKLAIISLVLSLSANSAGAFDMNRARSELNDIRRQVGLQALTTSPVLNKAAQRQAELLARTGQLSHTAGGSLRSRVGAAGFRGVAGENLGRGQATVSQVIIDWMKSPGHRANILRPNYSCFGIGQSRDQGARIYWVLILGNC